MDRRASILINTTPHTWWSSYRVDMHSPARRKGSEKVYNNWRRHFTGESYDIIDQPFCMSYYQTRGVEQLKRLQRTVRVHGALVIEREQEVSFGIKAQQQCVFANDQISVLQQGEPPVLFRSLSIDRCDDPTGRRVPLRLGRRRKCGFLFWRVESIEQAARTLGEKQRTENQKEPLEIRSLR